MRLLEKTSIIKTENEQKKAVIESGLFLAGKVDKLRNDLASLEKQRTDFINGSREALKNAVKELEDTKVTLMEEIRAAEAKLHLLQEPLDEAWRTVHEREKEIAEAQERLDALVPAMAKNQKTVEELHIALSAKEKAVTKTLELYENNLQNIQSIKAEHARLLRATQESKETLEASIYAREIALADKEKNIENREKVLQKERLELNKEKKLLAIKKQRIQ